MICQSGQGPAGYGSFTLLVLPHDTCPTVACIPASLNGYTSFIVPKVYQDFCTAPMVNQFALVSRISASISCCAFGPSAWSVMLKSTLKIKLKILSKSFIGLLRLFSTSSPAVHSTHVPCLIAGNQMWSWQPNKQLPVSTSYGALSPTQKPPANPYNQP